MRRRDFVAFLGGSAVATPFAARAQQKAMPTVGLLSEVSIAPIQPNFVFVIRLGLFDETGYVEGGDVAVEYRGADGYPDRLPALAADLVSRKVNVIVAGGSFAALAARKVTSTIPIVFVIEDDPVRLGLVADPAHPSGNVTGVSFLNDRVVFERLDLLCELVPKAKVVGLVVNPANPRADRLITDVQKAAHAKGIQLILVKAGSESEIDAAFTSLTSQHVDALISAPDPLFFTRREQIVGLASRYAIPTIYGVSEYAVAGGLISYGPGHPQTWNPAGVLVGKILKGAKPAELPVVQPNKPFLTVNRETAKALGIEIPASILARADF
jgi:putative ABC transport system substrate-binding protein